MQLKILRSGAAFVLLLLSFVLFVSCSGGTAQKVPPQGNQSAQNASKQANQSAKSGPSNGSKTTVKSIVPKDVLSKNELASGAPKPKNWNANTNAKVVTLPGTRGSSAGAIPVVKPFNFGRDPGGPADKTMYLTVPKLGIQRAPVYNEGTEEALKASTVHVPATGFPWQQGANTFIAGHRIGYSGTGSLHIFYSLNELQPGDEIELTDSAGGTYVYRVIDQKVVAPDNVQVMNPVPGKSIVSLQTCTLPDYKDRLIVQGELVSSKPA